MKQLILLFFLGMGTVAHAEVIQCTARTALNQTMTLSLDTEAMTLVAETNQGHRFSGKVNSYYSPRYGDRTYFLATGFNDGIEVQIEGSSGSRVLMCLQENSCYICR